MECAFPGNPHRAGIDSPVAVLEGRVRASADKKHTPSFRAFSSGLAEGRSPQRKFAESMELTQQSFDRSGTALYRATKKRGLVRFQPP